MKEMMKKEGGQYKNGGATATTLFDEWHAWCNSNAPTTADSFLEFALLLLGNPSEIVVRDNTKNYYWKDNLGKIHAWVTFKFDKNNNVWYPCLGGR